jgi:GAF domain-containing protein
MGRSSRKATQDAAELLRLVGAANYPEAFARLGVAELPRLVPSELTTLSVCDLASGRRRVVGNPAEALSSRDLSAFDRHFFEHPLVQFHSENPHRGAHRISDSLPAADFRHSALFSDYYRRIGIDHAAAVPLYVGNNTLVSFVLNRRRRDFSDDEIALLNWLRGGLSDMYRNVIELQRAVAAVAELREIAEADGWTLVRLDTQRRVRDLPAHALATLAGVWPGHRVRYGA